MINTLTLNPAIDKILYVQKFQRSVTTRIGRIVETIGGKGTHVSVNLQMMGMPNRAFGIAHGPAGAHVIEMLMEHGVDARFILKKEHNTRTNYLLAEQSGDATLITEKGVELTPADIEKMIQKLLQETDPGDFLAFSGDASNYADPFVYNHIMEALSGHGLKFFLDTSGASLQKAVQAAPFLIKPNLDELEVLCGRKISPQDADVMDAIHSLDKYHIPVVAVSLGGDGSLVRYQNDFYRAHPPRITAKNTVGCGDCFLAGLLYGFETELDFPEILRFATAAGAAAAECELSVGLSAERAHELKENIRIEKL